MARQPNFLGFARSSCPCSVSERSEFLFCPFLPVCLYLSNATSQTRNAGCNKQRSIWRYRLTKHLLLIWIVGVTIGCCLSVYTNPSQQLSDIGREQLMLCTEQNDIKLDVFTRTKADVCPVKVLDNSVFLLRDFTPTGNLWKKLVNGFNICLNILVFFQMIQQSCPSLLSCIPAHIFRDQRSWTQHTSVFDSGSLWPTAMTR